MTKVTVPVSIFIQQHLLSVPIGSKDSHENPGVGAATFDVSSDNRDLIEDLVRIGNNQKVLFKELSLTHPEQGNTLPWRSTSLTEEVPTELLDFSPRLCIQRQS